MCIPTLTTLSHPADTMIGLDWLGENLTQDTQSLWQSSWNKSQIKQFYLYMFALSVYLYLGLY